MSKAILCPFLLALAREFCSRLLTDHFVNVSDCRFVKIRSSCPPYKEHLTGICESVHTRNSDEYDSVNWNQSAVDQLCIFTRLCLFKMKIFFLLVLIFQPWRDKFRICCYRFIYLFPFLLGKLKHPNLNKTKKLCLQKCKKTLLKTFP